MSRTESVDGIFSALVSRMRLRDVLLARYPTRAGAPSSANGDSWLLEETLDPEDFDRYSKTEHYPVLVRKLIHEPDVKNGPKFACGLEERDEWVYDMFLHYVRHEVSGFMLLEHYEADQVLVVCHDQRVMYFRLDHEECSPSRVVDVIEGSFGEFTEFRLRMEAEEDADDELARIASEKGAEEAERLAAKCSRPVAVP